MYLMTVDGQNMHME